MTEKLKRVVVDSCVVLDLLIDRDPERTASAAHLVDGHGKRHTIVVPAIVIAEIAGTGEVRGDHLGPAIRADRIADVKAWIRASNFLVAELSERIARRAADLAVTHGLKGPDATVLATAEQVGSPHLYTRDGKLLGCDGQLGFKITEPGPPPPPAPPDPQYDLFEEASQLN
ncbi:type II toxin-antitoxin system VapC family toxin [Gordonia terrae]